MGITKLKYHTKDKLFFYHACKQIAQEKGKKIDRNLQKEIYIKINENVFISFFGWGHVLRLYGYQL